jgi:hypothetical protein
MDIPGSNHPPVYAKSLYGGNGHMKTTNIVETIESDRRARRAMYDNRQSHPGQSHSFPLAGFGTGMLPPTLKPTFDSLPDRAKAVLSRIFKVGN